MAFLVKEDKTSKEKNRSWFGRFFSAIAGLFGEFDNDKKLLNEVQQLKGLLTEDSDMGFEILYGRHLIF